MIRCVKNEKGTDLYMTDNADTECAYYPESRRLVVINNSSKKQQVRVDTEHGMKEFLLAPYETRFEDL